MFNKKPTVEKKIKQENDRNTPYTVNQLNIPNFTSQCSTDILILRD